MSTQDDVQTLVNLLSNNQSDTTLFAMFYADVVNTLGPGNWHTTTASISYAAGSTSVSLPATLLNLLFLTYQGTVLSNLSLRELEALNPGWRNVSGAPYAYTDESSNVKSVEVFPRPAAASNGSYDLAIYSESRTDILPYLVLPVALLVLSRDYMRESPYQDIAMGMLCRTLGNLLLEYLADIPAEGQTPIEQ